MSSYGYRGRVLPRASLRLSRCMPFPLFQAAVNEAENNIQAPQPLIVFSALTALSVALQGLYDVRKPNGQIVPLSLMLLSVANSGERKSTAENVFLDPVREFQRQRDLVYQAELKEWSSNLKIREAESKAILKKIVKLSGDQEELDAEKRRFTAHEHDRPAKPKKFKMLYDDSTSEAVTFGLYQDLPTAGLVSSEGSQLLNGRALNDLSKPNNLWSGDPIVVDRKTAESYEIYNARMSVSIMVQKNAFDDYIDRRGEKSRGSGLWARFLVCYPRSTQGTRFIKNGTMSWEHRDKFAARSNEILEKNLVLLAEPNREREVVGFSHPARDFWLEIFNAIESEIEDGGRFSELGDHASKLADNIARVAALLHLFEGFTGDISLVTLQSAVDFCLWCSGEFNYLFLPPKQEEGDAFELNEWLWRIWDRGATWIPKNYVRQYGPNKLREKDRLNRALEELFIQGKIRFFYRGKTQFIELPLR